ncbi:MULTISPECIES: flagellar hook protein FlgE [unclassified Azospirillum]|uniref:flagellar hook protein FlgE n=1 Tax=unclassified Azospirillum TaxID=2630922 RepID=UPI000B68CC09|nr:MULTISPECIES: flagellar hook protein FlgE [unclassified Azospirillum]SNS52764.1 flagellar hook protein FlgE [Azospirillum sp. RU38E]SNS72995.1 flagellar hook protein FlgE [Azospirillum sp. RU37A]
MSITNALSIATSGLQAQSAAFSSISSNIANVSTVGYKASSTSFESLLSDSSGDSTGIGGVTGTNSQNISAHGDIEGTGVATEMAIDGNGFFAVTASSSSSQIYYTRDGSFQTDDNGYLVNDAGYTLSGWALDENGNIAAANRSSTQSLAPINLADISGAPQPTAAIDLTATLPADAAIGDAFVTDAEIYDSLGTAHSVLLTWTKTAENEWTAQAGDPASPASTDVVTGTSDASVIALTFNTDGSLASVNPSPAQLGFSGWTSGAADSAITLDFGTIGRSDGVRQSSSTDGNPKVSGFKADQDGWSAGTLKDVTINADGTVMANFDNGQSRAVYKIPIVTFTNPEGLDSVSGTVYSATAYSGQYQLKEAGSDGAGGIRAESLEHSTADTATEMTRMIYAQQAYSAAAKVVTAAQEMMDTIIQAKR